MEVQWTWMCRCLCGRVYSPSSRCPRELWLSHMVDLVLVFWGTCIVISKVDAPVYSPTSSVSWFPFLRIHANICCHLYPWWWPFIMIGMRWSFSFNLQFSGGKGYRTLFRMFPRVCNFFRELFSFIFFWNWAFFLRVFFSSSIFCLLILY